MSSTILDDIMFDTNEVDIKFITIHLAFDKRQDLNGNTIQQEAEYHRHYAC